MNAVTQFTSNQVLWLNNSAKMSHVDYYHRLLMILLAHNNIQNVFSH